MAEDQLIPLRRATSNELLMDAQRRADQHPSFVSLSDGRRGRSSSREADEMQRLLRYGTFDSEARFPSRHGSSERLVDSRIERRRYDVLGMHDIVEEGRHYFAYPPETYGARPHSPSFYMRRQGDRRSSDPEPCPERMDSMTRSLERLYNYR